MDLDQGEETPVHGITFPEDFTSYTASYEALLTAIETGVVLTDQSGDPDVDTSELPLIAFNGDGETGNFEYYDGGSWELLPVSQLTEDFDRQTGGDYEINSNLDMQGNNIDNVGDLTVNGTLVIPQE